MAESAVKKAIIPLALVIAIITLPVVSAAMNAEEEFSSLTGQYAAFRSDPHKMKYKQNWTRIGDAFVSLAEENAGTEIAPRALFTAAEIYRELRKVSVSKSDFNRAVELYGRVVSEYPDSDKAAEAVYYKALMFKEVKGDNLKACETVAALLSGGHSLSITPAVWTEEKAWTMFSKFGCGIDPFSPDLQSMRRNAPMILSIRDSIRDGNEENADTIPLSVQLGLKIRRVIIDAGHGGEDKGAVGKNGIMEKDVVLEIAKKLAALIRKKMDIEVLLTRTGDYWVPLQDRTELARILKADIFISVHANANPNRNFRGVETYFLNNTDDRASQKVAAMENAPLEKGISDLKMTLLDLALTANVEESNRLATSIQKKLVSGLRSNGYKDVKDLGVKHALFYVLIGTEIPSVLIETSFLSNSIEEKRLNDPRYQEQAAEGILQGIIGFSDGRIISASR